MSYKNCRFVEVSTIGYYMAYIKTNITLPGIVELLFYKSSTGSALSNLAHTILHGPSPLTMGERELIASYVSFLNNCKFCFESHSAAANVHLNDNGTTIKCVITEDGFAPVSKKMKLLLDIAKSVQKGGKEVTVDQIKSAKNEGASDEEIHDTVLIAAAFCMYNRYVDGLGTSLPSFNKEYLIMGKRMAKKGYKYPVPFLRPIVLWLMKRK